MRIEVRLFATLRQHAPAAAGGVLAVDVPDGCKAVDAITQLGIHVNEIHVLIINGVISRFDHVLVGGDRLGLFPPVGGG
jgi:molybdopterin converting factor small subunit